MSITSVFTIGPFVPCTALCKILNTPVMSICLVKQNDGTWVGKHQRFLYNVYKRFFFKFCHVFLRFFTFFSGTFFFYIYASNESAHVLKGSSSAQSLSWVEILGFLNEAVAFLMTR